MVKYSELESVLSKTGIPCSEYHIENYETQNIEIPCLVYTATGNNDFVADGVAYVKFLKVTIELLTYSLGLNEEQQKVEDALHDADIYYAKNIDFDDEIKVYSTLYEITVIADDSSAY